MKKLVAILCCCLCAALCLAQARKPAGGGVTAAAAARLCNPDKDDRGKGFATGWPQGPVYVLFHREKSKAPWARNPAVKLAGIEATTPAQAHTLVCIEQSLTEEGKYDSGAKGYSPSWHVNLISLPDGKDYSLYGSFDGGQPPEMKFHAGAGVGKAPVEATAKWLRLIVDQKVARYKIELKPKEYFEISALTFSRDGSRLAMAQEPYHSSIDATPPTPVTVFDVASGSVVTTLHVDYTVRHVALSKDGTLLAIEHYSRAEIWEVPSGKLLHKFDAGDVDSLDFGPNDELAVAGKGHATVWNVASESPIRRGSGSRLLYSSGTWLTSERDARNVTVSELGLSSPLATFNLYNDQDSYVVSGDGRAVIKYSILGASLFTRGKSGAQTISLPSARDTSWGLGAVAPMPNGFVIGNSDGYVGLLTDDSPAPHAFVSGVDGVKALAISPDGKMLAVGGRSVVLWELQ